MMMMMSMVVAMILMVMVMVVIRKWDDNEDGVGYEDLTVTITWMTFVRALGLGPAGGSRYLTSN